jgi:tRNA (guanine-N7-)-methyltransferase
MNPEKNFLAIELKSKRIETTLKKLDIVKHKNIRLARFYVDQDVTTVLPELSISEIIINHPDPWPKRKHFKHRLIQHEFLDALYKILVPSGRINISTDDTSYRQWICKIFFNRTDFESLYPNGFTMAPPENYVRTYFDEKHEAEGFPPAFMSYVKRS